MAEGPMEKLCKWDRGRGPTGDEVQEPTDADEEHGDGDGTLGVSRAAADGATAVRRKFETRNRAFSFRFGPVPPAEHSETR